MSHDELEVRPVELGRIEKLLERWGLDYVAGEDRLLVRSDNNTVTIFTQSGKFDTLVFHSTATTTVARELMGWVMVWVNGWNQRRLGPVAVAVVDDLDGDITLASRSDVLIGPGMTDEQLTDVVAMSLWRPIEAYDYIFKNLKLPVERNPESDLKAVLEPVVEFGALIDAIEMESEIEKIVTTFRDTVYGVDPRYANERTDPKGDVGPMNSPDPSPVTPRRIHQALNRLNLVPANLDNLVDPYVLVWVNDILLGFFFDAGDSIVMTAHWNEWFSDDHVLQMKLACNDFNLRTRLAEAHVIYEADGYEPDDLYVEDPEGETHYFLGPGHQVGIQLDYVAPARGGMNDEQLFHTVSVGLNRLLMGVDLLSRELTGESAVHWPNREQ